jgi:hypothetical protein
MERQNAKELRIQMPVAVSSSTEQVLASPMTQLAMNFEGICTRTPTGWEDFHVVFEWLHLHLWWILALNLVWNYSVPLLGLMFKHILLLPDRNLPQEESYCWATSRTTLRQFYLRKAFLVVYQVNQVKHAVHLKWMFEKLWDFYGIMYIPEICGKFPILTLLLMWISKGYCPSPDRRDSVDSPSADFIRSV